MGQQKVTAVFDIGKTNKKFFLFDEDFNELEREYIRFDEVKDEDGFEGEDLATLVHWMTSTFDKLLKNDKYKIQSLNFSTYGASLVHLDENGEVVASFYNYLKPFPEHLEAKFLSDYPKEEFELETASPFMGMLNSGLQLYYLKYEKPAIFKKIMHSLHFPQYLSYLFTKKYVTDHTSLGCHTGLWDFQGNRYAKWVKDEQLEDLLAPIVASNELSVVTTEEQSFKVGVGVHDSSSALVPYINATDEPFVLISTGTWSICMNFFNEDALTSQELTNDCLNFKGIKGSSVKASRLFLGRHLSNKAQLLCDHFQVGYQSYKSLKWQSNFQSKRKASKNLLFDHTLIKPERFGFINNNHPDYSIFDSYEDAMMHLMDELTDLQIESLKLAIGSSQVKKIYLDGGFSASEVFVQFLANKLPDYEIFSTSFSLGTALGAALLVNYRTLPNDFLKKNYKVKKHDPLVI
ncbi:MAG: FGGY family carbohydrate kinase [Marinoscillum sp.]